MKKERRADTLFRTMLTDVSERTVRQHLNKHIYLYCTKQCKGIVAMKDCRKHKIFSKTVTNTLRSDFWTLCFYFFGVIFTHKHYPLEEACHCKSMATA